MNYFVYTIERPPELFVDNSFTVVDIPLVSDAAPVDIVWVLIVNGLLGRSARAATFDGETARRWRESGYTVRAYYAVSDRPVIYDRLGSQLSIEGMLLAEKWADVAASGRKE